MLPIFLFLLAMVTSKETCAEHHRMATKNIAPKRTIYWIIKIFKERGQVYRSVQQMPGIKSPPVQSLLRNVSRLMWEHLRNCEAKTFGQGLGVKKKSKEATYLQEKHQGQTEILQVVKGLDSRRLVKLFSLKLPSDLKSIVRKSERSFPWLSHNSAQKHRNKEWYQKVPKKWLLWTIHEQIGDDPCIFQHDGAPRHIYGL